MRKPLVTLPLLALLLAAAPSHAEPTFDAKALLNEAESRAADVKEVVEAESVGMRRYDSDCVTFTFSPTDANVSETVYLRSTEWVEECTHTGDPRHGGGRQCWERPGMTYNERVRITLQDRQELFPWEYDKFRVCLQGPWLNWDDVATAYEYKSVRGGSRDGDIVLAPVKKLRMRPDPTGILMKPLTSSMVLGLTDKWINYYAKDGEKVVLKVVFKKDVPNWFDPTLLETELEFPVVPENIDLTAYAAKFSEKLQAGKKYYVKLSFKRVGRISKEDWVDAGETSPVAYQPSLLARLR